MNPYLAEALRLVLAGVPFALVGLLCYGVGVENGYDKGRADQKENKKHWRGPLHD